MGGWPLHIVYRQNRAPEKAVFDQKLIKPSLEPGGPAKPLRLRGILWRGLRGASDLCIYPTSTEGLVQGPLQGPSGGGRCQGVTPKVTCRRRPHTFPIVS